MLQCSQKHHRSVLGHTLQGCAVSRAQTGNASCAHYAARHQFRPIRTHAGSKIVITVYPAMVNSA